MVENGKIILDAVWATALASAIGVIVTGILALLWSLAVKLQKTMKRFDVIADSIMKSDKIKTDNIAKLTKILSCNLKATGSALNALKELGANGSVTEGLKHINLGEDVMSDTVGANMVAAMAVECDD